MWDIMNKIRTPYYPRSSENIFPFPGWKKLGGKKKTKNIATGNKIILVANKHPWPTIKYP